MGLLENGFNENQSNLHSISLKAYIIPKTIFSTAIQGLSTLEVKRNFLSRRMNGKSWKIMELFLQPTELPALGTALLP